MSADGTMIDPSPVGGEVDRVAAAVAAPVAGPAARRAVAFTHGGTKPQRISRTRRVGS